jgi:ABC-type antimicrobial peptide transport system ATPase subunit
MNSHDSRKAREDLTMIYEIESCSSWTARVKFMPCGRKYKQFAWDKLIQKLTAFSTAHPMNFVLGYSTHMPHHRKEYATMNFCGRKEVAQ